VRRSAEIRRLRLFAVFVEPGYFLGNEDDEVGVFVRLDE